ncbi:fk506-binding protein [Lasallia pustulata]|uniref:peptidylprolyl isomerase n=1 Tax=Lasallia pustulata TaxID=136370 RepID=A0A1W5DAJ5_9LECA|nr:fk506-binding protein [Lasallia pustulata]
MAAIDPTAPPQHTGTANGDAPPRATLKIIRQPPGLDDEDDDSKDYLSALLGGADREDDEEDEESSSDDEEKNGGPSDPTKTKKARKEAAVEQLKKALAESNDDDEMELELANGTSGANSKGKAKATDDNDDDEDDDEDDEEPELEEFVICTLDPTKNYQQTLDITVAVDERVYFKVSGTHAIYLTGNYVIPTEDGHNHRHEIYDGEEESDEEDYDLSPDEDELGEDDESDELDALAEPRIVVIDTDDEEEAPKLIKKKKVAKKGKNKRAAEESDEEPASLDDIMAKSLKPAEPAANGEAKLSKKQLKKLKNNAGDAVTAAVEKKNAKKEEKAAANSPTKGDKKVQFAKKLEQGPASETKAKNLEQGPSSENKADGKKEGGKPTASLGVKMIDGVKIDDKKIGKGPAAKKGDKVGIRYIGKLKDGKVFDANKKGKPFTFTLGRGDVIKGWDIGVAGLAVGGERRIVVPAQLAYGSKSLPGIPANSELTFDLKLIEIK